MLPACLMAKGFGFSLTWCDWRARDRHGCVKGTSDYTIYAILSLDFGDLIVLESEGLASVQLTCT